MAFIWVEEWVIFLDSGQTFIRFLFLKNRNPCCWVAATVICQSYDYIYVDLLPSNPLTNLKALSHIMSCQIGSWHTRPRPVDPGPIDDSESSLWVGGWKGWAEVSESLYTIYREYCGVCKEDGSLYCSFGLVLESQSRSPHEPIGWWAIPARSLPECLIEELVRATLDPYAVMSTTPSRQLEHE